MDVSGPIPEDAQLASGHWNSKPKSPGKTI